MDRKTLLTFAAVALVALVVGGLIGYYAIPKKEGYVNYKKVPTSTSLDLSGLGAQSNSYISQQYTGVASKGDFINRYSTANSESRGRNSVSSKREAYAAPSYGLVDM